MENYKGRKQSPNWKWVIVILIAVLIQLPCILTALCAVYMEAIADAANIPIVDIFCDMQAKCGILFVIVSVVQAGIALLIK